MKCFKTLFAFVCLALAVSVGHAQTGMVTVGGSNLENSSGAKVSNAQICFAPVNNRNIPLAYQINGSGTATTTPVCTLVTSGTWSMSIADTNLTNPKNVCFNVTVIDKVTGYQLLGPGYGCVQPAYSTSPSTWCVSGTCNFDAYTPNQPDLTVIQVGPQGPAGTAGPNTVTTSTSTTVTGLLKGNGSSVSSASSSDIQAAIGSGVYDTSGAAAAAQAAAEAASVSLSSTSTQTLQGPLIAPWVNNVPDAGEFSGANSGAKIDAACAALSGAYGVAEVNPFVAGGSGGQSYDYNSNGLLPNCDLWDFRTQNYQPSANGYENQPYFGGPLFRARFTQQLPQSYDFEVLSSVFLDAAAGGVSNNGPSGYKTTMIASSVRERMNTIGQTYAFDVEAYDAGPGDMNGIFAHVKCHNRWYALADEGCHALRLEADQDGTVFTATVASITPNTPSSGITTLTLSSQVNPFVVGEQSSLIVTASSGSEAPYSTGTITGITGTPPVVTGSGTSWSGYCSGGQAYFALTASKELVSPNLPYIVPVASINSNTSLTLSYQIAPQGSAAYTLGSTHSGAYTLYCGEEIQTTTNYWQSYTISSLTACVSPFAAGSSYTPVNQANAGCVTSGSGPYTVGDSVAVYPAYNNNASTMYVLGSKLFNDGLGSLFFLSDNSGTEATWYNAAWIAASGYFTYGLELGGNGGDFINADIFIQNANNSNTTPVIKVTSNATQYQEMWSINNASSTYMGEEFDRTNSLLMPYGGAGFLLESGSKGCSISGSTATINPSLGDVECTLTANISTVTVTALTAGVHFTTTICQNSTGSYTWAWPSSFHGGTTVGSTANLCTEQEWRINSAGTIAYGTPGAANE